MLMDKGFTAEEDPRTNDLLGAGPTLKRDDLGREISDVPDWRYAGRQKQMQIVPLIEVDMHIDKTRQDGFAICTDSPGIRRDRDFALFANPNNAVSSDDYGGLGQRGRSCAIEQRSTQNGDNVGASNVLESFQAIKLGRR
jgi:hypothetical protein